MAKGVLTVITDKARARELVRASLEQLGYRVVTFADVREAAAYVEADLHLLDCGASRDLGQDVHRLEESAPVLILMPPGAQTVPAVRQASAGFIPMSARAEEYALRLEIARPTTAEDGYRVRAEHNGHRTVRLATDDAPPASPVEAPNAETDEAPDAATAEAPAAASTEAQAAADTEAPAAAFVEAPAADAEETPAAAPAEAPPARAPSRPAVDHARENGAQPLRLRPQAGGDSAHRGIAVVADHDMETRRLVAFKLRRLGFEPVEAADDAEALAALMRHTPTLVVVADDLRGVGGVEVLEQLRAGGGDDQPAAIVVTAESTAELAETAGRLDAAPLAKPFRVDDLGDCVDRIAAPSQQHADLSHTPGSQEMT